MQSVTGIRRSIFAAACAGLLLAACASPQATLHGDAAHPAAQRWLRTELYFGVGPVDDADGAANEKRWREFLDREVTPRFPDGLSVFDVYGQWRSQGHSEIERLHSERVVDPARGYAAAWCGHRGNPRCVEARNRRPVGAARHAARRGVFLDRPRNRKPFVSGVAVRSAAKAQHRIREACGLSISRVGALLGANGIFKVGSRFPGGKKISPRMNANKRE